MTAGFAQALNAAVSAGLLAVTVKKSGIFIINQ